MNKEEFIGKLEQALLGEVPQDVIRENMQYYDNYITGETKKGIREEDVIATIGDPRLIAKTIVDSTASGQETGSSGGEFYKNPEGEDSSSRSFRTYDLNKWYWKAAAIGIVVLVIFLVITIVGGIFSLLAPFVFPLLIIWFIFSLLRGPRR